MSDHQYIDDEHEDVETPEEQDAARSLQERMALKRDRRLAQQTEWFDVPGFEGVLAVECQGMSYQKGRKIALRHRKIRDTALQELNVAADQLIRATVGFAELVDGERKPVRHTWTSLAKSMDPHLSEDASARVAIFSLLEDFQVIALWNEWGSWLGGVSEDEDEDVVRDFGRTPSRN